MSQQQPRILVFAGSLRKESFNKKLAKHAAAMLKEAGAEVTHIDLADYPTPIYDGDIEANEGLPENAKKLKAMFNEADGFLIASPEYNSSISGALKNTIDWVSRKASPDEPGLRDFTGKTAAIIAASPGALGGLRGLYHLREILLNINVVVLPNMRAVSAGNNNITDAGIADDGARKAVENIAKRLVEVTRALKK